MDKEALLKWIDEPVFKHWLEGGKIQVLSLGVWESIDNPNWCGWDVNYEFRIHPDSVIEDHIASPEYMNIVAKPPLGVIPRDIHEENVRNERIHELQGAISRYYNDEREIRIEWVEEYNDLIKQK